MSVFLYSLRAACQNTHGRHIPSLRTGRAGLTLTEMLVSLALLGIVALSVMMVMGKLNLNIVSFSNRGQAIIELDGLYDKMQKQLKHMTWMSPRSYKDKIIFTTYQNNTYVTIGYQLTSSGGKRILQYSPDGGNTWERPYNIARDTDYDLGVNSEFLFCGFRNNCTRFTDSNSNGSWANGEGSLLVSGPGSALVRPAEANKIRLSNFIFNRETQNPSVRRAWPAMTVHLPKLQAATDTAPSIDVNSAKQNAFATNSGDFQANFKVRGITFDPYNRRLLLAGSDTVASTRYLYITNRDGVKALAPLSLESFATVQYDDVCLMPDGNTAILANIQSAPFKILVLNTSSGAGTLLSISTATLGLTSISAIACDPGDPDNFYIAGKTAGSVTQIKQVSTGGTPTGSSWSPSGIANTVTAMLIAPVTSASGGDFYLLNSAIGGSSAKPMTMVRVTRSPLTSTSFTINLANVGTTTTNASATSLGLAYDPDSNHMFLADETANKVYEFIPPRLLYE